MKISAFLWFKKIEVTETELRDIMLHEAYRPIRYYFMKLLGHKPKEQK